MVGFLHWQRAAIAMSCQIYFGINRWTTVILSFWELCGAYRRLLRGRLIVALGANMEVEDSTRNLLPTLSR